MRLTIAFLSIILLLPALAAAQDYSKLNRAADAVKDAADKVADSTRDRFRKEGPNSSDAIEHAFLAREVLGAARLMEDIVGDKYGIGDLRLAANLLKEMSEGFPTDSADWGRLKDSIDSLVFELGAGANGPSTPVEYNNPPVETNGNDVPESKILGRFFWNGEVDDEVQLSVRGTRIESNTITGQRLEDGTYSFTSALPRENGMIVRAEKTDGRGEVSVIQQPNAANNYTAIVRIRDSDGGARPYSIEIYWYRASGN